MIGELRKQGQNETWAVRGEDDKITKVRKRTGEVYN